MELYSNLKSEFLQKLEGKKGILYFDMDQTIYDFIRNKDKYPEYNQNTKWHTRTNSQIFLASERDGGQGINADVVNYLNNLKDDYVLVSNTSWHQDGIEKIPGMKHTFDFYGNRAGYSISSQMYSEELILEDREYSYNKAEVNKFFHDMIMDSHLNVNDYRIVQFEDSLTNAVHITDFVLLTRGLGAIENYVTGLDTVCSNDEIAKEIIKEEFEKYKKLNINFHHEQLGIHTDGVVTWCENNLK